MLSVNRFVELFTLMCPWSCSYCVCSVRLVDQTAIFCTCLFYPIHRAEKSLINSPDETAARALCCVDFYLDFFRRERTPSINEWNCALMTYFLKSLLSHFGDKSTRKWPLPNKGSRHWKTKLETGLSVPHSKQVQTSMFELNKVFRNAWHCHFFQSNGQTNCTVFTKNDQSFERI